MHKISTLLYLLIATCFCSSYSYSQAPVNITVNLAKQKDAMTPVWAWFGYDEPNYTYMKDGKKLLTEIAALSPVPVYVRAHNLLTSGNGIAALKWGSTNAYTEDEHGNPIYNWSLTDSIFDTYIKRGMKPLAQFSFMPEALSSKPTPYRHYWKPGAPYSDIYTGWAYPPNDYAKWAELVYQWVKHCTERYGKAEVESWYWELWNEPNIAYWRGTPEEYHKLYDYTADAVKRALPTAMMGGPESTGPSWDKAAAFLKSFLDHVTTGRNYVTGQTGSPIDFITFHAKGSPKVKEGVVVMNMGTQLRDISRGFEIVASYPTLKNKPIIIGESDPEGCAACSSQDYPENNYRNGTMYSSYTAASFARKYALADHFGINFKGAVTWAFEFEDQPWFNGFRDLATNGVDKPVLNVFRMFGKMQGNRVEVSGDLAYDYITVRDSSIRGNCRDINALATVNDSTAAILVWNYHDKNVITGPVAVNINVEGIKASRATLYHYRVDQDHSNSYEVWKKMDSPQKPTPAQYAELEKAGMLQMLNPPEGIKIKKGTTTIKTQLPGQAVSLLVVKW